MPLAFPRSRRPTGKATMTDDEVLRYRSAYANGQLTSRQIADMVGVGKESIMRMLRGETYAHVRMDAAIAPPTLEGQNLVESMKRMAAAGLVTKEDGSQATPEDIAAMTRLGREAGLNGDYLLRELQETGSAAPSDAAAKAAEKEGK